MKSDEEWPKEEKDLIIATIIRYNEIREALETIAEKVGEINELSSYSLDELEIGTSEVCAHFCEYSCGNSYYYSVKFPLSYLWEEDWESKEKEQVVHRKELAEKKREEERQKELAKNEQREKAQLERLKAKYEK